jgi:hypothetical protein
VETSRRSLLWAAVLATAGNICLCGVLAVATVELVRRPPRSQTLPPFSQAVRAALLDFNAMPTATTGRGQGACTRAWLLLTIQDAASHTLGAQRSGRTNPPARLAGDLNRVGPDLASVGDCVALMARLEQRYPDFRAHAGFANVRDLQAEGLLPRPVGISPSHDE